MNEQLNRKFKSIITEMGENGYKFSSVPENLLKEVVFHSVRAASATKKLKVSNGNIKAVQEAGGWADPEMVIRYSKAYTSDQEAIVDQMEEDFLRSANARESDELLRIIQDNPELVRTILSTIQASK